MIKKQLVLVFGDSHEENQRLTITDPKDDLNRVDIRTAMDDIIDNNIFLIKGKELETVVSAYTREVIVHEII